MFSHLFKWAVGLSIILSTVLLAQGHGDSHAHGTNPHHLHLPRRHAALKLATRQDNSTVDGLPKLLSQSTPSEVDKARAIVRAAIAKAAALNKARVDDPAHNSYTLDPSTNLKKRQVSDAPPLLTVTEEMAKAAALVAEADAWAESKNGTLNSFQKRAGTFWMGNIAHAGSWPFGKNPSDFTVFRDVTAYGAKGDGKTDDTAAIKKAVAAGKACGPGCYSSTTKGAIIYFPPGTYLVSSTIETYYGTQFIGDANNRPVIKAAASFIGLGVISTDHYVENGGTGSDGNAKQWFINTSNFYRQIRNFVIDITATDQGAYVAALHYQVAQATSLQFVEFRASTASTTTQQAIFAENGSGGFMSDLVFQGGAFGIYGGNQQFTAQRLTFNNVRTAVQLIWDWGWTWKSIQINNCGTGFKLVSEDGTRGIGSIMVTDSAFTNVNTGVMVFPPTTDTSKGSTGVTFDNVKFSGVRDVVVDNANKVYLAGTNTSVNTWVMGRIYVNQSLKKVLSDEFTTKREPTLLGENKLGLPQAPFFERAKPQYEIAGGADFINMKQFCRGDGVTDDTACFQATIDNWAGSSIIYVDAGSYILTDTITIPTYARVVGEAWAQLVATGSKFQDAKNPRPLLRVGNKGQRGTVELQDLIFTSKGPTAGVIFVEWNIRAASPGSAGMWDCHVRVGGAAGTNLESKNCPASKSGISPNCNAGSALMHVTKDASGYFENVWLWVADHDIDDPNWTDDNNFMTQCSVYVARGLLIESQTSSWYYGTASEHSVFYQYTLQGAKNVHMGMIQTEQPTPQPPAPFADMVGLFPGDPSYGSGDTKDAGWGLQIKNSSEISIHGAGLYSWFKTYSQDCLQTMDCQKSMIKLDKNKGPVRIHNLVTIGAVNMIEADDNKVTKAKDNQAVDFHPRWSQIAVFDPIQLGETPCKAEPDLTNPTMPQALLFDTSPTGDGTMWFAIFNGSPYNMKLKSVHSFQMGDWSTAWVDIPAGESLQVLLEYAYDGGVNIHHWDDQGEAYYELEGTGRTFHFHARVDDSRSPRYVMDVVHDNLPTNDVGQGKTVTLNMPPDNTMGKSVQWGLVGSELYGYWTTVNPPVTWMKSSLSVIGNRKLKHICMPGSHDAGMSEIDGKTPLANAGNSQTQVLDVYGQLVRGSRWFDLRPCLGNGGKQMLCHYSAIGAYQGANGQTVQEAIDNINRFMREYPGELVILDINDESGYDSDNANIPLGTYPRLTQAQWKPFLTQFASGIQQPCLNMGSDLTRKTMYDFIGDGKGCVVSLIRLPHDSGQLGSGQYPFGVVNQYNQYANTDSIQAMANDQIGKLHSNRVILAESDPRNRDQFFVLSWTLTGITFKIRDMAAMAFSHLISYGFHEFTPYSYPNVLYADYVGAPHSVSEDGSQDDKLKRTTGDLITLALAVKLQLASQNCYIGGGSLN